jgi:hypothetical protein
LGTIAGKARTHPHTSIGERRACSRIRHPDATSIDLHCGRAGPPTVLAHPRPKRKGDGMGHLRSINTDSWERKEDRDAEEGEQSGYEGKDLSLDMPYREKKNREATVLDRLMTATSLQGSQATKANEWAKLNHGAAVTLPDGAKLTWS